MGNPMFLISNILKMSYFCRWSSLSILRWFLLASISDGDICWMDSQMLMSSLFVACSLITMKIKNSWFWGADSGQKRHQVFFDTCLVSPLFLSPFSHAVFIYETTTISHLPLCSPHVPQSCSRELCIFSLPSFLSLPVLLTSFLSSGYIFFKTLEGTINTRCYEVSLWPLMKITSG